MQCVVLAGGLASRMRPITETIPKSLIEIEGIPFVHIQLDWLKATGVTHVVMSIGYKGEMLRDYVQSGERWGLKVDYVDEGKELRGTAGALRFAFDQGVLEDQFLVTYGDSFLPISFEKVFRHFTQSQKPALMSVFSNQGKWDKSNVWFAEGKVKLYDKFGKHPEFKDKLNWIDYGLSAFSKSVISERIPTETKMDLADVFYDIAVKGDLAAYESKERFYEIGSLDGLEEFRRYALDKLLKPIDVTADNSRRTDFQI